MLLDHFSGAGFRRLVKGDFIAEPRGFYHTFFPVFHISRRIRDYESYAVDEPDLGIYLIADADPGSLLGNKFRFHRGDQFSGAA